MSLLGPLKHDFLKTTIWFKILNLCFYLFVHITTDKEAVKKYLKCEQLYSLCYGMTEFMKSFVNLLFSKFG